MSYLSTLPSWLLGIIVFVLVILGFALYDFLKKKKASSLEGSSILETYTRDWTCEAKEGKLDPVVGREEEIERVIHILSRRRKNNPLLIGEPGVGKTAVIEGLALRISAGDVPGSLRNKRVLALDLTGMISGTKFRGELEERMKHLTSEIEALSRTVILFIDEIHIIEQSAGAEGAVNVSDILKPALARGVLQAVGATTWSEYEKYMKPDHALDRRFQPVIVGEPSDKEAIVILRGVRGTYEQFHGVTIEDAALEAAVRLSKKIKGRYLPDKAIDLIDEAGAKVAIEASGGHRFAMGAVHGAAAKAKKNKKPTVTQGDVEEIISEWTSSR